jgi:flagellar biosynthetic protein FlhB
MADSGERTEKPTKRRLQKARTEGNFPSSREFISGIQFLGFVIIIVNYGAVFVMRTAYAMRELLTRAFSAEVTSAWVVATVHRIILPEFEPLVLAEAAMWLMVVLAQLATTRLGISLSKLAPDIKRLNVLKKFSSVPAQNIPLFLQGLALLPVIGMVVYYEATENLNSFLELPWMSAQVAAARVGGVIETLMWRAAALFLVVGIVDLLWQNHRYTKQLKMSKHDIRQESKESEGNPHIKMRIRRLRRDLLRRQMMQDVPTATAVIVNPTHYAVAIHYVADAPGAPRVVAKGKNYLAARIRKVAIEHQVPIIENPPLAQALYKSAEVGQEIPTHLYRAVAEILAYIYRLMGGRLPG